MLSPRLSKKLNATKQSPAVDNPYTRLTVPQITLALGKSDADIKTLIHRGMPTAAQGVYSLPDVIAWLISEAAPTTAGMSIQKAVQDLEIAKLKREKLALEVDDKKDNTIPREERDRDVSALIEAFTSYMRNSTHRNMAALRSVHEADADVVVNQWVQELTAHMSRAVRLK